MPDVKYMKQAIELAKTACGFTNPNPMVGAVIVKDGRVLAEGCHECYGQLHAERNAISKLTESAEGATIYVTLEPCCHHGKQPPCTEAIAENKIARVVIGSRDPNPLVAGKGVSYLREHGIEVIEDFMKEECDAINPVFFHYITTKLPYVVMKYAMTADGKIATAEGQSQWITGEEAREHVHSLRSRYSAIMAGIGTVIADNPMLNCRIEGKHQPVRIIVDSSLRIPLDCKIVKSACEYRTIAAAMETTSDNILEKKKTLENLGIEVVFLPEKNGHVDIDALFEYLGEIKIDSVLVEGGGILNEAVMKTGKFNEVMVYIAPKLVGGSNAKTPIEGEGIAALAECKKLKLASVSVFEEDVLLRYKHEV